MCEINPKHKKFFRLEFFTNLSMSEEDFLQIVYAYALAMEQTMNEDARIRVHVHEEEPKENITSEGPQPDIPLGWPNPVVDFFGRPRQ